MTGAATINATQETGTIVKLIEKNIDVSTKLNELSDPKFDLKSLLNP